MIRLTQKDFLKLGKKRGFSSTVLKGTTAAKQLSSAMVNSISPHARALAKKPELINGNREHYLQVSVFDFFERHHTDIYDLLYAIPYGGKRPPKTAEAMKAEGQKSGYLNTGLDAARGIYHGLRCELKVEDGRAQPNQLERADKLRKQGYCVVFCYGFDCVIEAILEYWSLPAEGVMRLTHTKKIEQRRLLKSNSDIENQVSPSTERVRKYRKKMSTQGLTVTTFYTSVSEKKLITLLTEKLGYSDSSEMIIRTLAEKGEELGLSLEMINKELRKPGGKGCAL